MFLILMEERFLALLGVFTSAIQVILWLVSLAIKLPADRLRERFQNIRIKQFMMRPAYRMICAKNMALPILHRTHLQKQK